MDGAGSRTTSPAQRGEVSLNFLNGQMRQVFSWSITDKYVVKFSLLEAVPWLRLVLGRVYAHTMKSDPLSQGDREPIDILMFKNRV